MNNVRTNYDILGVHVDSTTDEIKRRYREMAKRFHPDHAKDKDKEFAAEMFSEIAQAYRVLVDPVLRSHYDSKLQSTVSAGDTETWASAMKGSEQLPGGRPARAAAADSPFDQILDQVEQALLHGNLAHAKALCRDVITNDPENWRAYCLFGDAHVQGNHPNRAITAYREAMRICPSASIKLKIDCTMAAAMVQPETASPAADLPASGSLNLKRLAQRHGEEQGGKSLLSRLWHWLGIPEPRTTSRGGI